jgi:hypothetical protein
MPVPIEREEAVAPFDTRAAAREQSGTLAGDLLEVATGLRIQRLDRVRGRLQRGETLSTQCPEPMALLRAGAARGSALQIERRDQVVDSNSR